MSFRILHQAGRAATWAALTMLVFSPRVLAGDLVPSTNEQLIRVTDVSLGQNGTLVGQLLDAQGRQLPIAEIQLTNGVRNWTTYTDNEGNFRIEGITGSTYQVQAAGQTQIIRAWASGTAPPKAVQGLLIVHDNSVVLGQHCGSPVYGPGSRTRGALASPLFVGGVLASIVAIPIAIHNDDDDPPEAP